MPNKNLVKFGFVKKLHGFKGELIVFVEKPILVENLKSQPIFYFEQGVPIPIFLYRLSKHTKTDALLVGIEGISDENSAKKFLKTELFINEDLLDPDFFDTEDIIGFKVIDEIHGALGIVSTLLESDVQSIITIVHESGKEILMPLVEEIVLEINFEKSLIRTKAPEGLIELYLL